MKKKIVNKVLSGLLLTSSLTPLITLVSCNKDDLDKKKTSDKNTNDPNKNINENGKQTTGGEPELSSEEISKIIKENDINKIGKIYFELEGDSNAPFSIPRRISDPSQITLREAIESNTDFEPNNTKIGGTVLNKRILDDKSSLEISILFKNNQIVKYVIKGFKQDTNPYAPPVESDSEREKRLSEEDDYAVNKNHIQKYEYDLEKIKNVLEANKYSRNFTTSESSKEKYNKIAEELNMPDYDTASKFGFVIPKYDESGNITGLDIPNRGARSTTHWYDHYKRLTEGGPNRNTGLPRKLINDNYAEAALQSYMVTFSSFYLSSDPAVQTKLERYLGEPKFDIYGLVNLIKTDSKKQEFKARLDKDKADRTYPNDAVVEAVFQDTIKQLEVEAGTTQSQIYDMYRKLYTPFMQKQWTSLIKAVQDHESEFPDGTIERLKKIVNGDNVYDFKTFNNFKGKARSSGGESGTAWILDYELPKNGKSYPTKWYFATNYHVINGSDINTIDYIGMNRLKRTDEKHIFSNLKVVDVEDRIEKISFGKEGFKRVFDARDVLNTNPSTLSGDDKFKDKEEFMDFAVFELDFEKFTAKDRDNKTAEEYAKWFTNNYANIEDKLKLKVPKFDYVNNYDKIDQPLLRKPGETQENKEYDNLYVVSYPKAKSKGFRDFYLKQYEDDDQLRVIEWTHTMWTNASSRWYDLSNATGERDKRLVKRGGTLSNMLNLRQFKDKPGVFDNFIINPRLSGDKFLLSRDDNKEYINSGIGMLLKNFEIGGGASGSAVRNQNNEIVGIIAIGFTGSTTSGAMGLRSYGYDYKGLYGSTYTNLPQYDLIFGGGKDQKTGHSYREKLKELYPSGINTYLMKNGVNDIPEGYKFNNNK
ncbi:hypothetical protein AAW50_03420 [Mycoplasmopsis canis]|uniref:Ig-specific serine endopeptidase MIP n=1 Tax=Mycoplasmopsis canis TaxID=29555 RepID=UPI000624A69A|nr:DUF31 family protein [Mycoplasmopsis canis]AKF41440.1 hypothetical protein AAW50_03420 [Mycoplasmopsis canis]